MLLAALCWWLRGHWFARVIMLMPLAVLLGLLGAVAGASVALNVAAPPVAQSRKPTVAPLPATKEPARSGWDAFTGPGASPAPASRLSPGELSDEEVFGPAPVPPATENGYTVVSPAPHDPVAQPAAGSVTFCATIGGLVGVVVAWFVSGLTIYYHRHQASLSSVPAALRRTGPPAYFTGSSGPKWGCQLPDGRRMECR